MRPITKRPSDKSLFKFAFATWNNMRAVSGKAYIATIGLVLAVLLSVQTVNAQTDLYFGSWTDEVTVSDGLCVVSVLLINDGETQASYEIDLFLLPASEPITAVYGSVSRSQRVCLKFEFQLVDWNPAPMQDTVLELRLYSDGTHLCSVQILVSQAVHKTQTNSAPGVVLGFDPSSSHDVRQVVEALIGAVLLLTSVSLAAVVPRQLSTSSIASRIWQLARSRLK